MSAEGAPLVGGASAVSRRPLDLIHTNNCSNPASMRVSGGLTLENITLNQLESWLDFLAGPLGRLLLQRRAAHGAK